jgi:ABC-type uncharacterized transport system permease subunit
MTNRSKVLAALGVAPLAVGASVSQAALDAGVTTSITNATADITEAGGLLIGLAAVVLGLRWVKAMFF